MSSPDQPIPDITEAVQRPLEQLGVRDATGLGHLFSQLETRLNDEIAELQKGSPDAEAVEAFRVRWLGRKQGIIRAITDNWLRSAPSG
ncbi:MAG: hypothetical protein HYX73_00075, partial [Acidobacteria bacterium]|nr:hypothetical protein [Acidobacteriota bacterium]